MGISLVLLKEEITSAKLLQAEKQILSCNEQ